MEKWFDMLHCVLPFSGLETSMQVCSDEEVQRKLFPVKLEQNVPTFSCLKQIPR